ncbi:MAG: S9 family peptidase [Candidatus Eremiobacteraeota bacterium]|nr:S9 family peptidase [Candidatus Eremiobacteraeota bacterium]
MLLFRVLAFFAAAVLLINSDSIAAAQTMAPGQQDPFLWLEDVDGARATSWVKNENVKTLAVLQRDPHFAAFYADALSVNEAKDRIPRPEFIGGRVYNFWQDAQHVRGIWRSTTLEDFTHAEPSWTTALDLDALATSEGKNWVWQGADCDSPSGSRCLVSLSEGGEDASTVREFDLKTNRFVTGGFSLPRGKQTAAWSDDGTLLVSREWQPGDVTASGYPYIVKTLRRAQPLASAVELFRGTKSDVSVGPAELHDDRGHRALFIERGVSFFESETRLVTPAGLRLMDIPLKSSPQALVTGRVLIRLDAPWNAGGVAFPQGALVSVDLAAAFNDPEHLRPTLVYAPGPRETLSEVAATRDRLVVTTYENVKGRAFVYAPGAGDTWSSRRLTLPDDSTIELASADDRGGDALIYVTSFLTPTTLWNVNANSGALATVKSLAPKFDASNDAVEQFEATSKDGTQIPYFIVHPKGLKHDGHNPTILYAYGGFADSVTPTYSGVLGKLWLERGGTYVIANIRGGGEFGPAWHEAGLKTHRQRIYDDFAAVAQDLIGKKITTPEHLGIQGGSNGGLLMGVEFTQHPELWNAVDMQVPLLDMLRFEKIAAGASWVGEYGSVANPDERAFLASISPYDNIKAGVKYPEPFVWTTTKDDRVGPQHARKFAAKLAAMGIPYLFYEVTEGGHGSGANIREKSFTSALELTYFTQKLTN